MSEPTVRRLAEASGGAGELVAPREDMAERIHRHFKRMLLPRAVSARVLWPAKPTACIPETLEAVYDGDTVHLFARFAEPPTGEAVLEVTLADGRTLTQRAVLPPEPAAGTGEGVSMLARLARARELKALTDAEAGAALAVCYQLLSPWTSYVVVAERAEGERAAKLPALRKVPHVLAAGWGGTGSVVGAADLCLDLQLEAGFSVPEELPVTRAVLEASAMALVGESIADARVLFSRSQRPAGPLAALIAGLNARYPDGSGGNLAVLTLVDLRRLGAPEDVLEALGRLVAAGRDERTVVIAFLHALTEGPARKTLGRNAGRVIRWAYKQLALDGPARESLREALLGEPDIGDLLKVGQTV